MQIRLDDTGLYVDDRLVLSRHRLIDLEFEHGIDLATVKVTILGNPRDAAGSVTMQRVKEALEPWFHSVTVDVVYGRVPQR